MTLEVPITVEGKMLGDPTTEIDMNGYRLVHFAMLIEPRPTDRPIHLTGLFQTEIPDVVTKGELAVNVRRSLRAGDLILVSRSLRISQWTDREAGHERSYLELAATDVAPSLRFRPAYIGRRQHPADRSIDAATIPPRATSPGVGR